MLKVFYKKIIVLLLLSFFSPLTFGIAEKERRYRVELIIFKTAPYHSEDEATEWGRPDITHALPFVPLSKDKLVLFDSKNKLAKRHPTLLHTAWIQTVGTKDNPTRVHVVGDKIDGIFEIYPGRQLFVTTDLAFFHPERESIQIDRIETTLPVAFDEINYVEHAKHGMIIMITPEVTRRI